MSDHLTALHEAASTANLLLFRWQLVMTAPTAPADPDTNRAIRARKDAS